jgi:hypothetical protein
MDGNRPNVLVIRGEDYETLDQVAALVTKDLVALLEGHRAKILAAYSSSGQTCDQYSRERKLHIFRGALV